MTWYISFTFGTSKSLIIFFLLRKLKRFIVIKGSVICIYFTQVIFGISDKKEERVKGKFQLGQDGEQLIIQHPRAIIAPTQTSTSNRPSDEGRWFMPQDTARCSSQGGRPTPGRGYFRRAGLGARRLSLSLGRPG